MIVSSHHDRVSPDPPVFPKWLFVLSVLFSGLGFSVGATLLLSPQSVISTVDFSAPGVGYLVQMWAVRQLTLGVLFLFATVVRSAAMVKAAYLYFLVMNICDIAVGFAQADAGLWMGASFMSIVSAVILYCARSTP